MDFFELEENISSYIEKEFSEYLKEKELSKPLFVKDNIDLDKYKSNLTVFFDFASFNFENLSNESQSANLTLDLYFVRRNGTPEKLRKELLTYISKFYAWFYKDRTLGGLVDFGTIEELNNYDAASGDKGIKISQITIKMQLEDD